MTYPRRKYFVSFVTNNIFSNCIYLCKGSFNKKKFQDEMEAELGITEPIVIFYKFQGWTFQ